MKNKVRQLQLFLSLKYTKKAVYKAYVAHAKQVFLSKQAKTKPHFPALSNNCAVKLKAETISFHAETTSSKAEMISFHAETISSKLERFPFMRK